jgi:hypothetical protein
MQEGGNRLVGWLPAPPRPSESRVAVVDAQRGRLSANWGDFVVGESSVDPGSSETG